MYIERVVVSGFIPEQRSSISSYIKQPLCNMAKIESLKYFTERVLNSTDSKYHTSADVIFIEASDYGKYKDDIVRLIKNALTKIGAKKYTLVRLFEKSSNSESVLIYESRFKDM